MRRTVIGALVCALALSASIDAAHAAPKKKKSAKAAQQEAPQSAELAKSMGDLKWGADREAVVKMFTDRVREKYKPLIAKATDAMQEDKLRGAMRDELGKLRSSVVDFNGVKTGWDASFLKPEFSHNDGESMFVVGDSNSQNYYFFLNGKLWKWYKAFNVEAFQGKKFDQFATALQGRFGKAAERTGDLNGQGKQKWLEWQDSDTRARAVDNNQFYGFYSLVFEQKSTANKLAEARRKADPGSKSNALVDSVTTDDSKQIDGNPDIIDRITGKIRHRTDAPEPAAAAGGGKSKAAVSASAPAPAPVNIDEDNDPLKGLL